LKLQINILKIIGVPVTDGFDIHEERTPITKWNLPQPSAIDKIRYRYCFTVPRLKHFAAMITGRALTVGTNAISQVTFRQVCMNRNTSQIPVGFTGKPTRTRQGCVRDFEGHIGEPVAGLTLDRPLIDSEDGDLGYRRNSRGDVIKSGFLFTFYLDRALI
jgi:hypothetical protein